MPRAARYEPQLAIACCSLLRAALTPAGFNLQSGTAEFSQSVTNASGGSITGRGTLITGGTGLNNLGSIALSSGITDVYGDVVNNTGNAAVGLQVSGNADVTFWDDVTNTSGLFRVSAGSSATFFGHLRRRRHHRHRQHVLRSRRNARLQPGLDHARRRCRPRQCCRTCDGTRWQQTSAASTIT